MTRKDKKSANRIYLKNMVGPSYKTLVRGALEQAGIRYQGIGTGYVILSERPDDLKLQKFSRRIRQHGMEVLQGNVTALAERITNAVIELVHRNEPIPKIKYSGYLSKKLGYGYSYLSGVFSSVNHITIQRFVILNKIERAKRLLSEGRFNLTEIAFMLDYSSVAHLSLQFKKITGVTPTYYRTMHKTPGDANVAAEPDFSATDKSRMNKVRGTRDADENHRNTL